MPSCVVTILARDYRPWCIQARGRIRGKLTVGPGRNRSMAKIIPDGWRELAVTGGAQREIETLAMLAAGLPDSYRVYHAVHWTNVGSGKGFSIYVRDRTMP
jgi:hypothetical protein